MFGFCTKLHDSGRTGDLNIPNTATILVLVASFKLTREKHSEFDFLRFHVVKENSVPSSLVFVTNTI